MLGDSHNFGRRVTQRRGRIVKPRTLLWEWLLLARESPLRKLLAGAAEADGLGADAFGFLPDLEFIRPDARDGGEVRRLELDPLPKLSRRRTRELAEIVGRALALFTYLGVADLHWENLALGADGPRIVFAPLDIEMILADLSLPTQTKLLPDADPEVAAMCRHACGVRRALPYLGKPIDPAMLLAMASAYLETLELLEHHARAIAAVFGGLPELRDTPIRVCLRGTDQYVRARTEPVWPPLLDEEAVQLARGDIPYFFRLYGQPGIRYYGDRELQRIERIPLTGDVPRLDPVLQVSRGFASRSRKTLREEGLFTVLGAFDHPSFEGTYEDIALEVSFRPRKLQVELRGGGELETKRNLSAFVGSVYLPCRCGEVRSVFVPPVTVCEPSA